MCERAENFAQRGRSRRCATGGMSFDKVLMDRDNDVYGFLGRWGERYGGGGNFFRGGGLAGKEVGGVAGRAWVRVLGANAEDGLGF